MGEDEEACECDCGIYAEHSSPCSLAIAIPLLLICNIKLANCPIFPTRQPAHLTFSLPHAESAQVRFAFTPVSAEVIVRTTRTQPLLRRPQHNQNPGSRFDLRFDIKIECT